MTAANGRVLMAPTRSGPPETQLATRIAALQAAATFAAGKALGGSSEIKAADVLRVAEAFEHWLGAG